MPHAPAAADAYFWEGFIHFIRLHAVGNHHHHHGGSSSSGGNGGGGGGGLTPSDALPSVDILTMILLLAAIMYAVCLVWAFRKCLSMPSPWNSKRFLVASVTVVCAVRLLTILGVAAMNVMNIRAHYSLNPNYASLAGNDDDGEDDDPHQQFFDKIMTVLFDVPNCFVVTTFTLLTLVWAECFLDSRLHTVSSPHLRSSWLSYFMAFNATLYIMQLALYASIFVPSMSRIVKSDIYVGITGTNFTAVALVLIFYVYLNILFSGFPYRSQELRDSLSRVSSVMTLWTFTRVLWGIATLVVFVKNIELLQDSHTPVWSFVVLLLLFFVCEIVPIIALLDYSYHNLLQMTWGRDDENDENDDGGNAYDHDQDGDEQVDTTDDLENSIRSWRQQWQQLDEERSRGRGDDNRAMPKNHPMTEPLLQDAEKREANADGNDSGPASSSSGSSVGSTSEESDT